LRDISLESIRNEQVSRPGLSDQHSQVEFLMASDAQGDEILIRIIA
jgi:hypothetical protein